MIAILQPFIPHYRKSFFVELKKRSLLDVYCYEKKNKGSSFNISHVNEQEIANVSLGPFLLYNPFLLLSRKYNTLVLMLHFGHITTWFLLLTKFIHRKKIVLWGQGISVKRYLKEEQKPSVLLKWMIAMADLIWFYTDKEKQQWQSIFPKKEMIALNNTISGIEDIIEFKPIKTKQELKLDFNITQDFCFIFCARFNNNYRRQDLLLNVIENLDKNKFGFLIIGEGPAKPDFSVYKNVYDYGAVYDVAKKQDLFTIADLYIQPGWVGLSIVEAMGYGKPVVTFKRSKEVLQCVEYYYLKHGKNALIFSSVQELISSINNLNKGELVTMQHNTREYVSLNLKMNKMVENAVKYIKK